MKLTLANIKEIKRNSDSPLLKRVCNYVIDRWSEYDDKKHIFTDVLNYGCQSGIVGELIYYTDIRRQVGQRRSAGAVRLQSKSSGVVRFRRNAQKHRLQL